jgi:methyltransferase family protein
MIRKVLRRFYLYQQLRKYLAPAAVYHMNSARESIDPDTGAIKDAFGDLKKRIVSKEWGFLNIPNDCYTLLHFLDRFAKAEKVSICELGVATGRTGNRLVEYLRGLQVRQVQYFGVDNLSLGAAEPKFEHPEMQFINGNRDAVVKLPRLDFVFIDACHCAECVYRDAVVVSRSIVKGGYLGFHDTALLGQYPMSARARSKGQRQHYGRNGESFRPLAVVEGITSSRSRWEGDWSLVIQSGDDLDYGGIRIYERIG